MKIKLLSFALFAVLVSSCDPTGGPISLVEGDIQIDVLISDNYNPNTHDLVSPQLSLKDNPDLLLFLENLIVEPGFTESKYIKIRNEGNYPISYQISLTLNEVLLGEVFRFSIFQRFEAAEPLLVFQTEPLEYAKDTVFSSSVLNLLQPTQFHIFELNLMVPTVINNNFNLDEMNIKFDFSILFSGSNTSSTT